MARSSGPPRSNGDKQRARRPGKGNPWANARSRSTAARARRERDTDVRATQAGAAEPTSFAPPDPARPTVKLQKLLADAGLGSRRELERWIAAGRVSVNGVQATLGDRVTGSERIEVDGKALSARTRSAGLHPRVLLLNKADAIRKGAKPCLRTCQVCAVAAGLASGDWT